MLYIYLSKPMLKWEFQNLFDSNKVWINESTLLTGLENKK